MAIGLKRGEVKLLEHNPEWAKIAAGTIEELWALFGSMAKDIQHVGSTAIKGIKAKPIIDIAVAVDSFDEVENRIPYLEKHGFSKSTRQPLRGDMLIVDGDERSHSRTHHIHIVLAVSMQWKNYICFRDYLNAVSVVAEEYEVMKTELAWKHPKDRKAYTEGKNAFMEKTLQAARLWDDFGREFTEIVPIDKGWSEDKKYKVRTANKRRYLLRVSPTARYDARKELFDMLQKVDAPGVPMCSPVNFGTCTDGVYSLHSWVEGQDLEEALGQLPGSDQYVLGLRASEILRRIHNIPAPRTQEEWSTRFGRKTDMKIRRYRECGLRFDGDDKVIACVEQNKGLLVGRPQCFQHGDYHVGNMMLENGQLRIIDFDRYDFADPWEEFNRIVWCAKLSPHFATGGIHGYFGGEPPDIFWRLLMFYIAGNTLSSIYWAIPFGKEEVDTMMNLPQDVLHWFRDTKNPIPTWYSAASTHYKTTWS